MTEGKSKSPVNAESGHAPGQPIEWIDGTIPYSRRFADAYYSRAGGLAETGHVFIAGNRLNERWPQLRECLIAETGFGTGLNFLATLRQWREFAPADATLQFLSFEQFPLAKGEMARALSRWPELADAADRLVGLWRPGYEFLQADFAENVKLTVFMSDANIRLPQLDFVADAWFLDGFAPSRNPQLWSEELLKQVFARTKPGGSFATYSAAGFVRRNLEQAGFDVERRPGFAGKREMLVGSRPA
ncbi:MAG: tRNA (5-methylaminomethyl-2-thiouridine)(34)-methyltransferase MnmD [Pseudomonadota bacterium]|nr:tRNA (5-methylaminomethyl-2-thiouridine)(34)-methyltransferase MnmD [Pseudomonadota bacterium]